MAHNRIEKPIAIVGGGIAGLSAAHELAKFYTGVHVFEAEGMVGGKARSQDVGDHFAKAGARPPAPFWIGEHGFRLFPHTYRHVIETMKEITVEGSPRIEHVGDRLIGSTEAGFSFEGTLRRVVRPFPQGGTALLRALRESFGDSPFGTEADYATFIWHLLKYVTSCPERRDGEYDDVSWLEYVGMDKGVYSKTFEPLLKAIPRGLNAMKPDVCSARSFGNMMLRFAFDFSGERGLHMEQVLAGPTTASWLEPWRAYLEQRGVQFHPHCSLEGFSFDDRSGRVGHLYFEPSARERPDLFDEDPDAPGLWRTKTPFEYFILAVPIEAAQRLFSHQTVRTAKLSDAIAKMRDLDHGLDRLLHIRDLPTAPMVGLQLYLREEMAPLFGHMFYPGSPWALTSVSQAPFWSAAGEDLARIREFNGQNGEKLAGVLSVIVSDWKARSLRRTHVELNGQLVALDSAVEPFTPESGPPVAAFKREVWFQLKDALNAPGRPPTLCESMLFGYTKHASGDPIAWLDDLLERAVHVDDNAVETGTTRIAKAPRTPLFIHPRGSYAMRPEAQLRIPNLLLASDYVRTETDLATMEAANEAARRAVLAILWREDEPDTEAYPKLYRQSEPAWALAAQAFDRILYRAGQGHFMDLPDLLATLTTGAMSNVANLARQLFGQEPVRGAPPPLAADRMIERAEALITAAGQATDVARGFFARQAQR